jgi:hypothetical protein
VSSSSGTSERRSGRESWEAMAGWDSWEVGGEREGRT